MFFKPSQRNSNQESRCRSSDSDVERTRRPLEYSEGWRSAMQERETRGGLSFDTQNRSSEIQHSTYTDFFGIEA